MLNKTFPRVPYGMAVHDNEEVDAVLGVLRTSTQMGQNVQQFESKIANLFSKEYGLMVNSGSSALMLAAEVMELAPGSEVITPALTFSTTVSCLIKNNLVPAFVDVQEGTYCIDPYKVERAINNKTRAICVPNLIGNLADWEVLAQIAKKYKLLVIEDSADTLAATLNSNSSGFYSDISITSFYGSHVINCAGNGGLVCFNSQEMYEKAKLLRSWGRSSSLFKDSEAIENRFDVKVDGIDYDAKFVFEVPGYNYEPSELGAAFGLVQLKKLESNIDARIENFNKHLKFFTKYQKWLVLPKQQTGSRTGWLAFPLTVKSNAPFTRKELQIFLEKRNIQTRVVFSGNITRQPGFKNIKMSKSSDGYPEADKVMIGGFLIACHHGLDEEMINHIYESVDIFMSQMA